MHDIFTGCTSKRWGVYPLKSEAYNYKALQDFCRQIGIPNTLRSDNAKSEQGGRWLQHCRDFCIRTEYTEPHHPQQNPAEQQAEHLNRMVRVALKMTNAPLTKYDWCAKWVKDVHNSTALKSLNWKTPLEISTGETPDISMFNYIVLFLKTYLVL